MVVASIVYLHVDVGMGLGFLPPYTYQARGENFVDPKQLVRPLTSLHDFFTVPYRPLFNNYLVFARYVRNDTGRVVKAYMIVKLVDDGRHIDLDIVKDFSKEYLDYYIAATLKNIDDQIRKSGILPKNHYVNWVINLVKDTAGYFNDALNTRIATYGFNPPIRASSPITASSRPATASAAIRQASPALTARTFDDTASVASSRQASPARSLSSAVSSVPSAARTFGGPEMHPRLHRAAEIFAAEDAAARPRSPPRSVSSLSLSSSAATSARPRSPPRSPPRSARSVASSATTVRQQTPEKLSTPYTRVVWDD